MASIKIALNGGKHLYLCGIYKPTGTVVVETLGRISGFLDILLSKNTLICMVSDLNAAKAKENQAFHNVLACLDIHRVNLPSKRVTSTSELSIDVCSNLNSKQLNIKMVHEYIFDHSGQPKKCLNPTSLRLYPSYAASSTSYRTRIGLTSHASDEGAFKSLNFHKADITVCKVGGLQTTAHCKLSCGVWATVAMRANFNSLDLLQYALVEPSTRKRDYYLSPSPTNLSAIGTCSPPSSKTPDTYSDTSS
ncbi:hypothetical protein J6590_070936 [Homalodisca vitripennis]|nr:hypothetical protein J6590_070936 [Homalodisca vitripennis]